MSLAGWTLSPSVALTELSAGGYVLVELDSLSCHELLDEAGRLLCLEPGITLTLDEERRQFLQEALRSGWIVTESGVTTGLSRP